MTGWHSVGAEAAWAEGTMREVEVADQPVVVARVGGRFWAVQGRCPHLRVRLARGTLQGKVITCPGHGSQFDITTGQNLLWIDSLPGIIKGMARAISKPQNLTTFPVKVEQGEVWVQA
jgi:nitrite reductase/ring-hydroxylating ferredoxin subunit